MVEQAPASRDFFSSFRRIPVPVHSMGPAGLLLAVNEAWSDYTGYSEADVVGRSLAEYLTDDSALRYRSHAVPEMIGVVPAGEVRSVEYQLVKRSGEVADMVLTARAERDPVTGAFLHSLAVLSDITARNTAEAALRHSQKLEALGALTGGVAHDFNNLLTVIIGSLQLLQRHVSADDARAARLVDAALQGATRGAALTNRLLSFTRQQALAPRTLDPCALIVSLRPMLSQLLGPNIVIQEALPNSAWHLVADPNQLEVALLNLASNARDAMRQGGTLTLGVRNATIGHSRVSAFITAGPQNGLNEGDYVVIGIVDTGQGMDGATLARAAEPFFTTKGVGEGTGLGLSMVYGFAAQSGGAIHLSSAAGKGTTVEVWLPRAATEPENARLETAAAPQSGIRNNLKILLVDDDPLVLASSTAMLEELGLDALTLAASGAEALAHLHAGQDFDLLITDYMMPGMSGSQLAAAARELRPHLPILLASGFLELDVLTSGTWPHLRKPFDLAELASALQTLQVSARPE